MKAWWLALQTRERMILIIAGAIVLIALIYLLIVEPVLKNHADLSNQVKAQQNTLAWMQQTSQRVKQLQKVSQSEPGSVSHQGSLLALMESSSQQSNMRKPIQRMEPEGKNGVKLWLEDADFDNLIRWVGELSYNQGVVVTRATISRGESPGEIDSRLSLQR